MTKQRLIIEIDADTPEQAIEKMNTILKYSEYGSLTLLKKENENGSPTSETTEFGYRQEVEERSGRVLQETLRKQKINRIQAERETIRSTKIIRGDKFDG